MKDFRPPPIDLDRLRRTVLSPDGFLARQSGKKPEDGDGKERRRAAARRRRYGRKKP